MQTAMGVGSLMLVVAALGLGTGCDRETTAPPPPAPEGTIKAEPVDLQAFCTALCDRSARCGLEKARARVRAGDPTDAAALTRAESRVGQSSTHCAERCRGDHPGTKQALRDAERARICLSRATCEPFIECMRVL
jgi:hypothetical protein